MTSPLGSGLPRLAGWLVAPHETRAAPITQRLIRILYELNVDDVNSFASAFRVCERKSARLPGEPPHRGVQPFEGEREHPPFHQLANHADRRRAAPVALGHRVEPDRLGI